MAPGPQVTPQSAGHRGEYDVVDRAPGAILDPLQGRELRAHPGKASIRTDPGVERRPGRGEPGADERAGGTQSLDRGAGRPKESADASHRLGRAGGPLHQRLGEDLRVRGLRVGEPRLRLGRRLGVAVEIEEDRGYVNPGDAVDERVVGLPDDREAPTLDVVDQPQLPDRLGAVEAL